MNKKANLYLNVSGFISFVLTISIIYFSLRLENINYHTPYIIELFISIIGFIFGILFISIESFLFILMKNKNKLLFIGYILIEVLISIYINTTIPYSFLIVFISLNLIKDLLRIKLVDKIYINKEFNRYCKMFNIKINDFSKKKITQIKRKEKVVTPYKQNNKTPNKSTAISI